MKMCRIVKFSCLACFLVILNCYGSDEVYLPAELEPWKAWVLQDHKDLECPYWFDRSSRRHCDWSSNLSIDVNSERIQFEQAWQLFRDGWVRLPGSPGLWPVEVTSNNNNLAVIEHNGAPSVYLKKGRHQIRGRIPFTTRPTSLPLPGQSGIVSLTVDQESVDRVNVRDNILLLGEVRRDLADESERDTLIVEVFRNVLDKIPVFIETRIKLTVSGRDREVSLGRFIPSDGVPTRFESALPSRIESDGRIRLQVKAGEWDVTLVTRHSAREPQFTMEAMDESWPREEIWSFTANRGLRLSSVSGAKAIDPSISNIPAAWRHLPAYLLDADSQFVLTETEYADDSPDLDDLVVNREIWLDFDGTAMTATDSIQAGANRSLRFTAADGFSLGRATLNGDPQVITRMSDGNPGLELREGPINLTTISRIANESLRLNANGWQQDLKSLSIDLNLPPGWLLLHVSGPDTVQGSWVTQWDLWGIFLVLLVAGSIARLLDYRWGLLTLIMLGLTYHDLFMPTFLWVFLVAGIALSDVIPDGSAGKVCRFFRNTILSVIVLFALVYVVEEVRKGLYPQVEHNTQIYSADGTDVSSRETAKWLDKKSLTIASSDRALLQAVGTIEEVVVTGSRVRRRDPSEKIQTGPGQPDWHWNRFRLQWDGPVVAEQLVSFYVLSPTSHRILRFLKVILLSLTLVGLIHRCINLKRFQLPGGLASRLPVLVMAFFVLNAFPDNAMADPPGPELLEELEKRLTRPPECAPRCASMVNGDVSVAGKKLTIEIIVDAQANTAFPLPVADSGWIPLAVTVDGSKATLKRDQGGLVVRLDPGQSQVSISGAVVGDDLKLRFRHSVHHLTTHAADWAVSGLEKGTLRTDLLQLNYLAENRETEESTVLIPDPVIPFLEVERTFNLGIEWTMTTIVSRVAPVTGAVNIRVPLITGEAVITPGVDVDEGEITAAIPAGKSTFRWESTLSTDQTAEVQTIRLQAPTEKHWVEVWMLDASTRWHTETTGVSPVSGGPLFDRSRRYTDDLPTWRPWPGERLDVTVSRPASTAGGIQTVEKLLLQHTPGKRSSTNNLIIAIVASHATDYPITLPDGATVKEVTIDGQKQLIQDTSPLVIPIHPGEQSIAIKWSSDEGIGLIQRTPVPTVSIPTANLVISLNLPGDRWPLLVGGPSIGPALLYWGVLIVIVLIGLLLGRVKFLPVTTVQWLLLGVGMSTVNITGSLVVVVWFFTMAMRGQRSPETRLAHNGLQIFLVIFTLAAAYSLLSAIPQSLLSSPQMQITGNGSTAFFLQWYQDRTDLLIPSGWVISLPIWIYRVVMLFWSLWLVFALLKWAPWAWQSFSHGIIWRGKGQKENAIEESNAPATRPNGSS